MKYSITVVGQVTLSVSVEADSLEEALELASEADNQSFCHQCATGDEADWSLSGEIDCSPSDAPLAGVYDEDGNDLTKAAKEIWGEK